MIRPQQVAPARRPLVSFVIPAYNAELTIADTVRSALDQSYPDVEVVVVDDGSTDDTRLEVEAFGRDVRLLTVANGGHAAARAHGHEAASGDLIAWMDADDLAAPDRLARQVDVLVERPDVQLVSTDFESFGGTREVRGVREYYHLEGDRWLREIYGESASTPSGPFWVGSVFERILQGSFVHPPTVTFRRSAYERIGFRPLGVSLGEDWSYFIEIARLGPFAYIDEALLRYRLSDAQMSSPRRGASLADEIVRARIELGARHHLQGTRWFDLALGAEYLDLARYLGAEGRRREAYGAIRQSARLLGPKLGVLSVAGQTALPTPARSMLKRIRRRTPA